MALLPGSPAIDAGNNDLIPSGVTTDQRGTGDPRIVNGTVDIGAFEFGGSTGESQTISFGALANQTYGATPSEPHGDRLLEPARQLRDHLRAGDDLGKRLDHHRRGDRRGRSTAGGERCLCSSGIRGSVVYGQYGHAHDPAQCGPIQGLRRGGAGPHRDGHRVRQRRYRLAADRSARHDAPRRAARSALTPSRWVP